MNEKIEKSLSRVLHRLCRKHRLHGLQQAVTVWSPGSGHSRDGVETITLTNTVCGMKGPASRREWNRLLGAWPEMAAKLRRTATAAAVPTGTRLSLFYPGDNPTLWA